MIWRNYKMEDQTANGYYVMDLLLKLSNYIAELNANTKAINELSEDQVVHCIFRAQDALELIRSTTGTTKSPAMKNAMTYISVARESIHKFMVVCQVRIDEIHGDHEFSEKCKHHTKTLTAMTDNLCKAMDILNDATDGVVRDVIVRENVEKLDRAIKEVELLNGLRMQYFNDYRKYIMGCPYRLDGGLLSMSKTVCEMCRKMVIE